MVHKRKGHKVNRYRDKVDGLADGTLFQGVPCGVKLSTFSSNGPAGPELWLVIAGEDDKLIARLSIQSAEQGCAVVESLREDVTATFAEEFAVARRSVLGRLAALDAVDGDHEAAIDPRMRRH